MVDAGAVAAGRDRGARTPGILLSSSGVGFYHGAHDLARRTAVAFLSDGRGASIPGPDVARLLDAWSAAIPGFIIQERSYRPAREAVEAAELLAVIRACATVWDAVPTEQDMLDATPLAARFDLFYRFVSAFHGAPRGDFVPAGVPRGLERRGGPEIIGDG